MDIIIVAVAGIGLLWLVTSRTRKQQRSQTEMRNTIAPGDEVMTGSGLYGTVVSADGDIIVLETSPGVEQRWARGAILRKVDPPRPDEDEADSDRVEDAEPGFDEFEIPDDASGLDPDDKKP